MEKTTGHKSQWEYFETMKMIFSSDRNIIDNMPVDKSGSAPNTISEHNSFGSQLDEPLIDRNYLRSQKVHPGEGDSFDMNEYADEAQEDVDELRILKDNIIRKSKSRPQFIPRKTMKTSSINRIPRPRT